MREAVSRLGLSSGWIERHAKEAGVEIRKGNGKPMLDWTAMSAWLTACRWDPTDGPVRQRR